MKACTSAICVLSEMNSNAVGPIERNSERAAVERGVDDGAFVDEPEERGPRRQVEDGDHIHRVAGAPGRSGAALPRQSTRRALRPD